MTARTRPRQIDHSSTAARNETAGTSPVRRKGWARRLLAGALLTASVLMMAFQFHAAKTSAARHDPYLRRITLHPSRQADGVLRIDTPLAAGSYTVDLIFPGDTAPLDYGIAYHEARRHVRVEVHAGHHSTPLVIAPSLEQRNGFEDQLDSRNGVELCSFHADSAGPLTVSCQLTDGPPWPEEVAIGISHDIASPKPQVSPQIAGAAHPLSIGMSALFFCASVALGWRGTLS